MVDGANISAKDKINIYLINVSINTSVDSALRIKGNVEAAVTIHLTGTNSLITKDNVCAGLQKDNKARLIIKTNNSDATAGILNARSIDGDSAGIGGGYYGTGSCSNIIIDSCSVIASSKYGAGIGGSKGHAGSDITINNSSVTASSTNGAGIGSAGGTCSNIGISGGSVKAYSDRMPGINCTPHNGNSTNVYCCIIKNEYFLPVTIDSESWKPSYHIFPDSCIYPLFFLHQALPQSAR